MRIVRFGEDTSAGEIRALSAPGAEVEHEVRAIVSEVREGGDAALERLTARFDHAAVAPSRLRVDPPELERAVGILEPRLLEGLETARANVRAVARAGLREPIRVELPEGQRVEVSEQPVRRAGAYVPGGRAPYASTVVMCAETARVAGVEEIAVCAPPGPGGEAHPVILAACCLCGVSEVYRMGGAQAVAALAYGTDSVPPVDVVVGPGNRYVQEAKRQISHVVGIDSLAGPSELVVVASAGADPDLVALDLRAQGEHGPDALLVAVSHERAVLEAVEGALAAAAAEADGPSLAVVQTRDAASAVALADRLAPEHLELVGDEVERLAGRVRSAGCLFVGLEAGTAFGDYVAGSNHVLPTGGAARFQSALGVGTFRRRMARVTLGDGAAARLAPAGAALAEAEGFPIHGESMSRRA